MTARQAYYFLTRNRLPRKSLANPRLADAAAVGSLSVVVAPMAASRPAVPRNGLMKRNNYTVEPGQN